MAAQSVTARWLLIIITFCLALFVATPGHAQVVGGPIYTVDIQGPITSITTSYMARVLQQAESASATAVIVHLRSGGGVVLEARTMAEQIAAAQVPVVVYVAPGTQAGATGTLLLSGAHIAAMAPGTSFGSAYPLTRVEGTLTQQTRDLVLDSLATELRDWNNAQGRNVTWIDQAVRDGLVLNNEQAVALNPPAVDVVAVDDRQLLTLLDGRTINLASGNTATLATLGSSVTPVAPTLWESLRLALANPTIAFALLVMGAMAIYMEFAAPGSTLFAGTGIVLLAGAFAGLMVLPLQWWAVLLIVFALVLIGAEFFVSSHGGLVVTGLALLVVGALNMIDPAQAPQTGVAVWAIAVIAAVLGGFAALGAWLALRSHVQPVTTGQEGMIGRVAEVRRRLDPEGMVFVEGALWQAVSEGGAVEVGDVVQVSGMHNLRLIVRPIETEHETESQSAKRSV